MNGFNLRHSLALILAAFFWGTTFVAQSIGAGQVGTFTYLASRSYIGFAVLIPVVLVIRKLELRKQAENQNIHQIQIFNRSTLLGGLVCGSILVVSSGLQQAAMATASTGKAGFLTAMYILGVPILGLIFLKKRVGIQVWIGVVLSIIGLYLLCATGGEGMDTTDLLLIGCAVVFSIHILAIDHFSLSANLVAMSATQFLVCGVWSTILMFLFETPRWVDITAAWLPICYAGVLSSGVAYTLQIVGQKDFNPTIASLLMSLESVFSAVAGWIVLGESMTVREIGGCVLMFIAIILAQLPDRKSASELI